MEEKKLTSEDIFYQFCEAKQNNASDFMNDYILYQLNISNPFDDEKYNNYIQYILDFMVASDPIFDFYLNYLSYPKEYFTQENFFKNIENEFKFNNENLSYFFYSVFLSNINNLIMLKSKKISEFDNNELKMYKTNIQMDFSSSSLSENENNFKVLMRLNKVDDKNNKNNLFEIDEKDLDNIILKLKDIYGQIKS
jgi:hypothetical protein